MAATTPIIRSVGSTSGAGTDGEGRNDLVIAETVTLTDQEAANAAENYLWNFVDLPIGSSSVLNNAATPTADFSPDVTGSYWVECIVNGVFRSRVIIAVPLPNTGERIPAFDEGRLDFNAGGNTKGWHPSLSQWMRDIDAGLGVSPASHGALSDLLVDDHTQYQLRTEKNAVSGYAGLDGSSLVALAQIPVLDNTKLPIIDSGVHGNQSVPSLHAIATVGLNGFMSAADKTKLDAIVQPPATPPRFSTRYTTNNVASAVAFVPFDTNIGTNGITTTSSSSGITYSNNTGRFTIPAGGDGAYLITLSLFLLQSSAGILDLFELRKNATGVGAGGVQVWAGNVLVHSSVDPVEVSCSVILDLVATDTVEVTLNGSGASTLQVRIGSTFNILKVG